MGRKKKETYPHAEQLVMRRKNVEVMGMILDEWKYHSCTAHFGVGKEWATLYDIESKEEGKGHATGLLTTAKHVYEIEKKEVRGTIALNDRMREIYKNVGIPEIPEFDEDKECDLCGGTGEVTYDEWDNDSHQYTRGTGIKKCICQNENAGDYEE